MNEYQAVLLSIVSSLIIGVPILLLELLLSSHIRRLNYVGLFLTVSLIFLSLYSILVVSSLMGSEDSTRWTISYFTSYITNQFLLIPLTTFFKLLIANRCLENQQSVNRCLAKFS